MVTCYHGDHDKRGWQINAIIHQAFFFSVCTKTGKWAIIYMLGVLILRLSTIFLLDFGTVPTAFFILLFQICMYVCMYIKLTFYLIVINKYYNEMETQHE